MDVNELDSLKRIGSKIAFVPRVGHCKIDGQRSFIKKITDKGVVFFYAEHYGNACEKLKDFLKRKYEPI